MGDEVSERHAGDVYPPLLDQLRSRGACDDDDIDSIARQRTRDKTAHAAGAENRDLHEGSINTPGFMISAGSTARRAPDSASANGSGHWRSYQGL